MQNVLIVFIGGGLGSISRYLLTKLVVQHIKIDFPLGTFLANILGCFLIGVFVTYLEKNTQLHPNWALLLTTGFCGGFTTFSTLSLENIIMLKGGDYFSFIAYTLLSLAVGFSSVFLGIFLMKKF